MEPEHTRQQDVREDRDLLVVVAHVRVVELARVGDLVLGVGQFALQLKEVRIRFQVRVRLGDREQLSERLGEHVIGQSSGSGALGVHQPGTGGSDVFEDLLFVCGVPLDRLHQVRDQA